MPLSNDLISQFVRITNDDKKQEKETIAYGTIREKESEGKKKKYVQLDGSEILTPFTTTINVEAGERVSVMIKNHITTVTGNLSQPAARTYTDKDKVVDLKDLKDNADKITELEILVTDKANDAETLIAQLKDSISMLVTDGNGTSLMTQTEDGWTFSTSDIQSSVNSISEALNSLTTNIGDIDNTVDILQQAVDDLGEIAEYVKIGTYEDEPCIELGEGDSDFKLRITNTRMIFTEGSVVLAYFNNQSLHIKKAVVEEELQQGGFVWKARSNGNLGLVWKGATS